LLYLAQSLRYVTGGQAEKAGILFRQGLLNGAVDLNTFDLAMKAIPFVSGKRKGAKNEVNKYLTELLTKNPNTSAKASYGIAIKEAGMAFSPFEIDSANPGMLYVKESGEEISFKQFENRLSKQKNKMK